MDEGQTTIQLIEQLSHKQWDGRNSNMGAEQRELERWAKLVVKFELAEHFHNCRIFPYILSGWNFPRKIEFLLKFVG